MSLSTSALVTLEEVRRHLGLPDGATTKNGLIEDCANRASDIVSGYLDRQLVNVSSYTEYHTFQNPSGVWFWSPSLSTRQWPIITVTSVHECSTWPRTWASSTLLTADTHYTVSKPYGVIHRLGTSGATSWASGLRSVRVIYTAGYTQAAVPQRIKAVVLRLVGAMWAESERKLHGISSQSDQLGNFTRFSVARLTDDMKGELTGERRARFFETGEVDA